MKSYPIVYQGDIATALNNIGITDFMILNNSNFTKFAIFISNSYRFQHKGHHLYDK